MIWCSASRSRSAVVSVDSLSHWGPPPCDISGLAYGKTSTFHQVELRSNSFHTHNSVDIITAVRFEMMVSRCISRIVLAISRGVLRGQHRQLEPVCGHCLQCTAGTSSVLTADSIARSFSSFFPRRVSDRSGKPGAVKKKASEAEGSADSVNHSIQETLQQSTGKVAFSDHWLWDSMWGFWCRF